MVIQESAEFDTEKPLRITGPPESVERARAMVSEILNQNDVSLLSVKRSLRIRYLSLLYSSSEPALG